METWKNDARPMAASVKKHLSFEGILPALQLSATVNIKKVTRVLGWFVAALAVAHVLGLMLYYAFPGRNYSKQIFRFFDLGEDANLPTLFSTLILFAASALLFFLHRIAKARTDIYASRRWLILSMVFLFLCIDEAGMIHDVISDTIRSRITGGAVPDFLWITWVIPYAIFTLVVGLYFIPFLWKLPKVTRLLFIVSGVLYVTGAMGFEVLESPFMARGYKTIEVHELELVEEVLEMGSIVLFIYALLAFIHRQNTSLLVELEPSAHKSKSDAAALVADQNGTPASFGS